MIVTPSTVLRLAALVLVGVVLQLAVVSQLTFLGASADLAPLIVLSVGLLGGPIAGVVVGFFVGLAVDMVLVQTLGVTSLLLIAVGYLSGRYRDVRDVTHTLVPPIGGALATLVYAAGFSVIQFLLGVESSVSPLVIRYILVSVLLNALLAGPAFAATRATLRPSLIGDLRPRRRPTATGLRIPAG